MNYSRLFYYENVCLCYVFTWNNPKGEQNVSHSRIVQNVMLSFGEKKLYHFIFHQYTHRKECIDSIQIWVVYLPIAIRCHHISKRMSGTCSANTSNSHSSAKFLQNAIFTKKIRWIHDLKYVRHFKEKQMHSFYYSI